MLKRTTRLTASVAALLTASTAFAEPTIEELDMRMRAMENTMQSILELLQEQQSANAAPTATPAPEGTEMPVVPAGYQMGAIYLDVFTKPITDDELYQLRADPAKLPSGPNGVPSGSVLIKPTGSFSYGAFTKEASLAPFADADALVSVQWFGVLEIKAAGEHTIAIQLKKGNDDVGTCRSVLRLSGTVVADAKGNYGFTSREQVDVAQSTQELSPGLYDFSLWTTCAGSRDNALKVVTTEISVAAPGDRAPKPISPDRFGVQP